MHRLAEHKQAWLVLAVALSIGFAFTRGAQAHKVATSPYFYNEHVFPILRDRCGRCHADDGPAPMSLLTYQAAFPWAVSIREQLSAETMPPWYADPAGPAVKGDSPISARELDMIITWAAGGAPQGDPAKKPAEVASDPQWKAGPPDLILQLPAEHVLDSSVDEETADISLPTHFAEMKWIRAADLQPGTPSIVRDAIIATDGGDVLSVWVPGGDVVSAPGGGAFKLEPGGSVRLQIHYKKRWNELQQRKADQSRVGLYFTDAPVSGRGIQSVALGGSVESTAPPSARLAATLASGARVIAIRPSVDRLYASLELHALTPTGRRVPLLLLRAPNPDWDRRYWLADPIELPAGSRVEATVTEATIVPAGVAPRTRPLRIALDYISE